MTTPTPAPATTAERPGRHLCWPEDPDWLDGKTEIEISLRNVRARWDADILDIDDQNVHDTIIEREDSFIVRFRVQLEGRIWHCMCGHWCFDVGFTTIGEGPDFNLSQVLPDPSKLNLRDWRGCEKRCIEVCVTVPPGTIPVERCGIVYDVAAWFELRCCGECRDASSHLAVAGYENLRQYMFV